MNASPQDTAVIKQATFVTLVFVACQSGAALGLGNVLGAKKQVGVGFLIAVISFLFAFEQMLRNADVSVAKMLGLGLGLTAVAAIPYFVMTGAKSVKAKDKAKAGAAALPVSATAWILTALIAAKFFGGLVNVQGALLSIMYMALSALGGYSISTKQRGQGIYAMALWLLLFMFDLAGVWRSTHPQGRNTPGEAAGAAANAAVKAAESALANAKTAAAAARAKSGASSEEIEFANSKVSQAEAALGAAKRAAGI
jgi:hypothetical protein